MLTVALYAFARQASQAPTEPPTDGFDFDAHIAKLIAASQMELESQLPPRGWEDGIDKSRIIRRPKGGQLEGEDEFFEEDEFGDDDEEFDDELAPSADPLLEEKFEEVCHAACACNFAGKRRGVDRKNRFLCWTPRSADHEGVRRRGNRRP
jgi:hypothetical protein